MHPELKAYLDDYHARTMTRYDAVDKQHARMLKILTGVSTPQPACPMGTAADGGLTDDARAPAVVPDVFSAPSYTSKAQEVLELIPNATPACIARAPVICSTDGSNQVLAGVSAPQPVRPMGTAADGGLTNDARVPTVVPDAFSSTTKAQEIMAAPHGASLDSIDPTPMTCSTTGSTQVDAVANVDEAQDAATTIHPEHAVIINYTEVTQFIPLQAALSIDIIHSPQMPMKRDMGIEQQGQLLHPTSWSSFAYHSESAYLEAAAGSFWFVSCPTGKLWCCWQYEHRQQWPPPVPVQILVNNAALFHDTARGCVYDDFGYVWWPPDHQLWMRNELRAWLTPNQHPTGVVHLSHNVKNAGTFSAKLSSQKVLQLTQFKQNQYSLDRATHTAEVQGIESHLQNVIQLWVVDVFACLSMAGVEEISCHGTFATHTGYLISCMSRPCPWPSFDCFHEGAHLSSCQAAQLWSELLRVEFQTSTPGSPDPNHTRESCCSSQFSGISEQQKSECYENSYSTVNNLGSVVFESHDLGFSYLYLSRKTWWCPPNEQQKTCPSEKVICGILMVPRFISIPSQKETQLMDNVDFMVAVRLFFISSMQPSYELHAQVQQTSCGRRLSVSVELQSYDVANLRPRPWPMFEFTQEIIQPKLHLASVSGNYCTTHVVFKQNSCSQLYLQIGHMRFTCDELSSAPGMTNLEFTDPATYFASLLLTSPAINHTGFSYSSTTVTTLKLQFTVCPTESLWPGLLLYEEDGQQYDNELFQLVSEGMSHTAVISQFIFTLHGGHSTEFCNPNWLLPSAPALKKLQLLGYTSLICSGFIQRVPCGYDSSTTACALFLDDPSLVTFITFAGAAPSVVWSTKCMHLVVQGSDELLPCFLPKPPWSHHALRYAVSWLVIVAGSSPCNAQFDSKEAMAWACHLEQPWDPGGSSLSVWIPHSLEGTGRCQGILSGDQNYERSSVASAWGQAESQGVGDVSDPISSNGGPNSKPISSWAGPGCVPIEGGQTTSRPTKRSEQASGLGSGKGLELSCSCIQES